MSQPLNYICIKFHVDPLFHFGVKVEQTIKHAHFHIDNRILVLEFNHNHIFRVNGPSLMIIVQLQGIFAAHARSGETEEANVGQ